VWIGLTVAFASALVTNTAYSLEHDAAAALPRIQGHQGQAGIPGVRAPGRSQRVINYAPLVPVKGVFRPCPQADSATSVSCLTTNWR